MLKMRMIPKWRLSASLLISSAFFYSALTFAQTAFATAEAASPTKLSTYNAEFLIYRAGKNHGSATRYLHDKGTHYEMGYNSNISWLVFSDRRTEKASFTVDNAQLRPLSYLMKRSGTGSSRHYEWQLDWDNKQLFTGKKLRLTPTDWHDNWLDPLSFHKQLVLDLKAGKTSFSYNVLNRDGNTRTYHYALITEEPLALPYGTVRALRIARVEEGSDKQVLAWLAPELDYMLVRLWRGEDNVEQFDVQLHKLTWLERQSEPDGLTEME